jgi:hypothetical protein
VPLMLARIEHGLPGFHLAAAPLHVICGRLEALDKITSPSSGTAGSGSAVDDWFARNSIPGSARHIVQ